MTRVPLDIEPGKITRLRAALIPGQKLAAFTAEVDHELGQLSVNPGAVTRWRMGWLTQQYPHEEIRLMMASGLSVQQAAQNIARRIKPYSVARDRMDVVLRLLVDEHRITRGGQIIDDWIIIREDWTLVDDMNRYVINGRFDASAAASALAEELRPLSDAWRAEIEAAFDEAEDRADREVAEEAARRDAEKLKAKYLAEYRAQSARSRETRE